MIISFGEILIDCLPDENVIGGAPFNVAINLKRFNNDISFVSKIGVDDFGKEIYDFAKKESVHHSIQQDSLLPTGYVSVSFINNEPQYKIEENVAWQKIDNTDINDFNYLIFGSLATYFEPNKIVLNNLINSSNKPFCICDLNLRSPFYNDEHIIYCLEHTDLLKVNEDEWDVLIQLHDKKESELIEFFKTEYNIIGVIITKGDKGATFLSTNEEFHSKPEVISKEDFQDPIGAGDGFLAAFLNEWIKSKNTQTALDKGVKHASLICKNKGAILPK